MAVEKLARVNRNDVHCLPQGRRRSMSDSVRKDLGQLNRGWGICGFTSTFYAMYHANPVTRGWLVNASQVFSVLYEICDYLKMLQAAGSPLIKDIEAFTQSFGDEHATFTVPNYIAMVETSSESTRNLLAFGDNDDRKQLHRELRDESLFGIAMPPVAVADYIKRVWKWNATITEFKAADLIGDAIVGVRNPNNTTLKKYNGLCHYLYRGNGKYYSWGGMYPTLAAANPNYEICYAITIRKY
jgi:hypothetical protein